MSRRLPALHPVYFEYRGRTLRLSSFDSKTGISTFSWGGENWAVGSQAETQFLFDLSRHLLTSSLTTSTIKRPTSGDHPTQTFTLLQYQFHQEIARYGSASTISTRARTPHVNILSAVLDDTYLDPIKPGPITGFPPGQSLVTTPSHSRQTSAAVTPSSSKKSVHFTSNSKYSTPLHSKLSTFSEGDGTEAAPDDQQEDTHLKTDLDEFDNIEVKSELPLPWDFTTEYFTQAPGNKYCEIPHFKSL
ncbi:hypothetical protein HDU76_011664, partial [Blyttiomyces sp. JEL0837]